MKKIALNLILASLFLSPVCASKDDRADQAQAKMLYRNTTPSELCNRIEYDSLAPTRGGLWNFHTPLPHLACLKYHALMQCVEVAIQKPDIQLLSYKGDREILYTDHRQTFILEAYQRSLGHALEMVTLNGYSLGNLESEHGPLGNMSRAIDRMNAVDKANTSISVMILQNDWGRIKSETQNIARILEECRVIANDFKTLEWDKEQLQFNNHIYAHYLSELEKLHDRQRELYTQLEANKNRFELAAFSVKDWLHRSKSDL